MTVCRISIHQESNRHRLTWVIIYVNILLLVELNETVDVLQGEKIELKCPPGNMVNQTWLRQQVSYRDEKLSGIIDNKTYGNEVAKGDTYVIENAQKEDESIYVCSEVIGGRSFSLLTVTLNVISKYIHLHISSNLHLCPISFHAKERVIGS